MISQFYKSFKSWRVSKVRFSDIPSAFWVFICFFVFSCFWFLFLILTCRSRYFFLDMQLKLKYVCTFSVFFCFSLPVPCVIFCDCLQLCPSVFVYFVNQSITIIRFILLIPFVFLEFWVLLRLICVVWVYTRPTKQRRLFVIKELF